MSSKTRTRKAVTRKASRVSKSAEKQSARVTGPKQEIERLTRELDEAREQQAATSEVLEAINRSSFDLRAIVQMMIRTAARLCKTGPAGMFLLEGDVYRYWTGQNVTERYREHEMHGAIRAGRGTIVGRAAMEKRVVQITDALEDSDYEDKEAARVENLHSMLGVPLLRDGELIGVFALARTHVEPFTESQIRLVSTANQAVIAIDSARLFEEVQARTRELTESLQQQTATSEVLEIISSSFSDLAPVFEKTLENATRVCGAQFGSMLLVEGGMVRQAALYNAPPALAEVRVNKVFRPHPQSPVVAAIRSKQVRQVADPRTETAYLERTPATVEFVELGGVRTAAWVPMVRDNEVIGVVTIYRQEVRVFDEKQIELVRNFAKQAVIAIENARLLKELRQRTADLSKSLDDLRIAQDRLIQTEKLASLGQLTAGIAHEIKNPLNFVNNFSALSVELVAELKEALTQEQLTDKGRGEVDELTSLLKDNLGKVVQHGKRADSIVKNMLLHSREGSGERRPANINALVGESLNLAYHGARAEKPGFAITLKQDLDPNAGALDLYPQEITRALLNLISNGFYAATRRKAEAGDETFEPVLTAATKDLGETVEIRIRDNGIGIPPEVREKMFNPFFTTKPTGEGTGLGLSMTHDIIVKQHGGRIDVETEPGTFTEIIITLPRDNGTAASRKPE